MPHKTFFGLLLLGFALPVGATPAGNALCGETFVSNKGIYLSGNTNAPKQPLLHEPKEVLEGVLRDGDTPMKIAAARALRRFFDDEQLRKGLLDQLSNPAQSKDVRIEIIKGLAPFANEFEVKNRILQLAQSDSEDIQIRTTAFRALFVLACKSDHIRNTLLSAIEPPNPLAIRQAAAWALFSDADNTLSYTALLKAAKDSSAPPSLRIEAIRSLAGSLSQWDVQFSVYNLAKNKKAPAKVREAAILSLHRLRDDRITQLFLMETAQMAVDLDLRKAAIRALGEMDLPLALFFHHSRYGLELTDRFEAEQFEIDDKHSLSNLRFSGPGARPTEEKEEAPAADR